MYSFRIRYVIVVVFVLTQQFIFACVADVTNERTVPGKVVTSFFKAPWINSNIPWPEKVTSRCRNDVETIFHYADAGEIWALQMLDATSKMPSGFLKGNIIDFGMYDECIGVRSRDNPASIQGQHCMVSVSIPSKFVRNASALIHVQRLSLANPTADVDPSLTLSVCLPSSCSVQDVAGFANASIQSTPELAEFEVSVAQVKCLEDETGGDLTMGAILTILFFALIASVLLFCTGCDFVVRARPENTSSRLETLARFSVYTNAIKLFSTKASPGNMPAINGIRFLSTVSVVILHRAFITLLIPLVNISDFWELRQSKLMSLIMTLPYVVDTFFLLSGFLATHSYLKRSQTGVKKSSVLEFYLHRYIRLAPSMCVLVLFVACILPLLGSGPMWQTLLGHGIGYCQKNWWANLLFVQNLASRDEMCIPHAWYSATEMQFFLLSPIILYPLFHRPRLGLTMLSIFLIAALITPAVQILVNNYAFLFDTTKNRDESYFNFFSSYTVTYNRGLPYLIGMLLGYDVVNNKRQLTKVLTVFNWILACIFIILCFWNTHFIQPNAVEYDVVSEAIHVSLGRLGWTLAVAWILYACTHGYGGPVTRFLSLPIFVPLSRISYNIYLVHFLIQVIVIANKRVPEFFTKSSVRLAIWSDLGMSVVVAIVLNLCIETPALILEEVMRGKRPTAITRRSSTTEKEDLSAVVGKYLDLAKSQVASDSIIEMQMPHTDFWRTMSDVLNMLSKGPRKTPAEWATTWREWKKNIRWETRAKDIQSEAAQTRVPTLKQELLIFLVAVSCGLDYSASSCQLGSYNLENKDLAQLLISKSTPNTKKTS